MIFCHHCRGDARCGAGVGAERKAGRFPPRRGGPGALPRIAGMGTEGAVRRRGTLGRRHPVFAPGEASRAAPSVTLGDLSVPLRPTDSREGELCGFSAWCFPGEDAERRQVWRQRAEGGIRVRAWKKRCKRMCAAVLVAAVILRGADSGILAAAGKAGAELLRSPGFGAFFLYLQTGRRAEVPSGPSEPSPEATEPVQAETELPTVELRDPEENREVRRFSPEEAAELEVKYGGDYRPDLGELLARPVELDFSGEEPRVLIVSTHATEAYAMEAGWEYTPSSEARTLDTDYNVIRVGSRLAELLRAEGISVIHDTTLNDYPSYNGAYGQAASRIQSMLEQYPSIQMVIDVHRDAIADEEGNQIGTARTVNGVDCAQVMLVMGTDEGGLSHPDWEGNLSWALKIQKIMDEQAPGLARPLNLRTERFNENMTPGSILLEVGTAGDTLQEALTAVELFAGALITAMEGI